MNSVFWLSQYKPTYEVASPSLSKSDLAFFTVLLGIARSSATSRLVMNSARCILLLHSLIGSPFKVVCISWNA